MILSEATTTAKILDKVSKDYARVVHQRFKVPRDQKYEPIGNTISKITASDTAGESFYIVTTKNHAIAILKKKSLSHSNTKYKYTVEEDGHIIFFYSRNEITRYIKEWLTEIDEPIVQIYRGVIKEKITTANSYREREDKLDKLKEKMKYNLPKIIQRAIKDIEGFAIQKIKNDNIPSAIRMLNNIEKLKAIRVYEIDTWDFRYGTVSKIMRDALAYLLINQGNDRVPVSYPRRDIDDYEYSTIYSNGFNDIIAQLANGENKTLLYSQFLYYVEMALLRIDKYS